MKNSNFFLLIMWICGFMLFCVGCVDPVEPEYIYKDGLVYVDGFVSTTVGESLVKLSKSVLKTDGSLVSEFLSEATVSFVNADSNILVSLTEGEGVYLPPDNFVAEIGDTWKLDVQLKNGEQYQSLPETLLEPVPISDVKATYDPELLFSKSFGGFVPGHSVSVAFSDPPNKENYYYWRFRYFEELGICGVCYDNSIYRGGECTFDAVPIGDPDGIEDRRRIQNLYFTYQCLDDCWRIRYGTDFSIFSDEFVDGNFVSELPVANVLLLTKKNILVEVEQYSLSNSAFKYYEILQGIIDGGGNFNAPPPAGLIGNIFNPNDNQEFVLGRFTAASTSVSSVFIRRDMIQETKLGEEEIILSEEIEPIVDPLLVGPLVFKIPCKETKFSTGIRPQGWED